MKLDKRSILASSLILTMCTGLYACSEDDKKDDKPIAECTGQNEKKSDDGKCVCVDGYTKNAEGKCAKNQTDEKCTDEKKELINGKCVDKCGENQYRDDNGACQNKQEAPETCRNQKLDPGELCDIGTDGKHVFADEAKATCSAWKPGKYVEGGKPECSKNCLGYSKGTCKLLDDPCGNGNIDEGELCDVGLDKVKNTSDDVLKNGITCDDFEKGKAWKEGGKPGCSMDCQKYAKGTCSTEGGATRGIVSCKATITVTNQNAAGSATVATDGDKAVTGAIVCAPKSAKLDALIKNAKLGPTANASFDGSKLKDAGEYGCFFYVQAEGEKGGVLCSADGAVKELADVDNVGAVSLAEFKIESSVAEDTLAKWTFVNFSGSSIATELPKGIAPDEGVASALKLKWVPIGAGSGIGIVMTMGSSGTQNAIQLKTNGKKLFGTTQKAEESSHLTISDISGYVVSSLKLNAKYEGAKLYITKVSSDSEALVKTLDLTKEYVVYEVTGFDANSSAINIYGDSTSGKAVSINDIELLGTGK